MVKRRYLFIFLLYFLYLLVLLLRRAVSKIITTAYYVCREVSFQNARY